MDVSHQKHGIYCGLYNKPSIKIQYFDKSYNVSFMNRNNRETEHSCDNTIIKKWRATYRKIRRAISRFLCFVYGELNTSGVKDCYIQFKI